MFLFTVFSVTVCMRRFIKLEVGIKYFSYGFKVWWQNFEETVLTCLQFWMLVKKKWEKYHRRKTCIKGVFLLPLCNIDKFWLKNLISLSLPLIYPFTIVYMMHFQSFSFDLCYPVCWRPLPNKLVNWVILFKAVEGLRSNPFLS